VLNAVVILCGGLTSSLASGFICDKFESRNIRIKSHVCTFLSFMGVPCFLLIFLIHSNFYVALGILFLQNLLSEGWMAPSIAMIQTVIDVKYKAVSVAVFFFATAISQTIAAVVLGEIITKFELNSDKIGELGLVLALFTAGPCLLASYCFYKCGKPYEDFKAL
jgi:hypothetical protein